MRKRFLFLLVASGCLFQSIAQNNAKEIGLAAITEEAVRGQMEFLASDWTEGREMGTKGAYLAADYIKSMFKLYGLQPAGDNVDYEPTRYERLLGSKAEHRPSYFQNFNVIKYVASNNQTLSLSIGKDQKQQQYHFQYKTDFMVKPSDIGQQLNAPVVFVGYGIKDDERGYNDFKGVDVEGKIVVRLQGYPGHLDSTSGAFKKFEGIKLKTLETEKNNAASALGALAVIDVSPNENIALKWSGNTPFRQNLPMYEGDTPIVWNYNNSFALPKDSLSQRIPIVQITNRVAHALLKSSGLEVAQFEKKIANKGSSDSKELKDVSLAIKTDVISESLNVRNVLGIIEGEDTENVVVVGAHYDHLGKYNGYIWNGADDNASGTVGIMTIAKACMATGIKPKRTIIFAAWTGEERGLMGSRHFVKNFESQKISVALNYDMISRDNKSDTEGNKCSMIYTKAYPTIAEVTKMHNEGNNLGLNINYAANPRPIGGSDNGSFAEKDIPVFWFFIGSHEDYHRPSDHYEKANWKKFTNIIKLGFLNVWEFANSPDGVQTPQ